MSVIGIDLGTTSSSVSIIKNGSAELLNIEKSNKKMPSCVAFAGQERLLGKRALAQLNDNPKNTICDVKPLIGLTYKELQIQKLDRNWPFDLREVAGKLKIVVQYEGTEKSFYPEEITSMILSRLWNKAKKRIGEDIKGTVITVPASFNHAQRKATMDAAKIAEIPVVKLINEPTAAALAYRHQITERQEVEKERKMLILHMGGGAFNVSVVTLGREGVNVKASIGNSQLGGRDFDDKLFKYFASQFYEKVGHDILNDSKAACKLRLECQTAKKKLSAAKNVRVAVKALYKGIDFQSSISREEFRKINKNIFTTIVWSIKKVLEEAKFEPREIDDILTVGNSTRLPHIACILERDCGLNPQKMRQTIKPDEAAACGAALVAAVLWNEQNSLRAGRPEKIISQSLKEVRDVLPYSVIIDVINKPKLELCSQGFNFSCLRATNLDQTIKNTEFELKSCKLILVKTKKSWDWKEKIQSMSKVEMSCDDSRLHKINFKINGSGIIEITVELKVDDKCGVPTDKMRELVNVAPSLRLKDEKRKQVKKELYKFEKEVYKTQRLYGCELNELIEWITKSPNPSLDDIKEKKKELKRITEKKAASDEKQNALKKLTTESQKSQEENSRKTKVLEKVKNQLKLSKQGNPKKRALLKDVEKELQKPKEESSKSAALVKEKEDTIEELKNKLQKSEEEKSDKTALLERVKNQLQKSKQNNSKKRNLLKEVEDELAETEAKDKSSSTTRRSLRGCHCCKLCHY